ncbi:hypothetical protein [Paraferrimonas sp. SM1919]|uniref:hypothetical protein n=1 Tax=Paraferrimonas sp. SM1919 TaxID=2662263 RepID=UPI0013D1EFD0|nr:hypothetical protein [Paraferrimonas sp. SM1919]
MNIGEKIRLLALVISKLFMPHCELRVASDESGLRPSRDELEAYWEQVGLYTGITVLAITVLQTEPKLSLLRLDNLPKFN